MTHTVPQSILSPLSPMNLPSADFVMSSLSGCVYLHVYFVSVFKPSTSTITWPSLCRVETDDHVMSNVIKSFFAAPVLELLKEQATQKATPKKQTKEWLVTCSRYGIRWNIARHKIHASPPQVKMKKVLYIIHYITVVRDCDCIFPAQPLERKLKGGLLCNRGRRRAEDGEGRSSERVWGALGLTCGNDFSLVLVVLGESALEVWGCVRAVIVPLYTIYY